MFVETIRLCTCSTYYGVPSSSGNMYNMHNQGLSIFPVIWVSCLKPVHPLCTISATVLCDYTFSCVLWPMEVFSRLFLSHI